jgi:ubiquinone biosynthesis protein Coq4
MTKLHKQQVKIRSAVLVFLTHNMALPVLKLVRRPLKFPFTEDDLEQMQPGSLGNDLIHFLKQRNLQLLPYYAKHDIKHILLEYDTTDEGEVSLQCFMLGNGHISFPVTATVIYGFVTMPEYWGSFIKAYKRGKRSIAINDWQWFALLQQPTKFLIRQINITVNEI